MMILLQPGQRNTMGEINFWNRSTGLGRRSFSSHGSVRRSTEFMSHRQLVANSPVTNSLVADNIIANNLVANNEVPI